jgi:hypothetical protein
MSSKKQKARQLTLNDSVMIMSIKISPIMVKIK